VVSWCGVGGMCLGTPKHNASPPVEIHPKHPVLGDITGDLECPSLRVSSGAVCLGLVLE
jgi:hypothetical protein